MPIKYPPISKKVPHILHGADYNPDQWFDKPEVLAEDMRLMKLANCNAMSIGIFSWAMYEREEGKFTFDWMDRVMDMLAENNISAILATPSGSKPAWMSKKYPEICRVQPDGKREPHAYRHNHCMTSPIYREKVAIINTKLAERYKNHPALILWHISNEYGGECFCDLCIAGFRAWLKKRYGTLDALNKAWWTSFWSHQYTDWDQIAPNDFSIIGLIVDWRRFETDLTVDFFKHEIGPLKTITPDVPITTNMMGAYQGLNYWKFAPHVDVVSWDNYPEWHSDVDDDVVRGANIGFVHDINRSLKNGKPFMLMESTPSTVNWREISRPKQPGMHMLSSLQAVAHGADTVQYFQWRKGLGGTEKFHGAVVDHVGHENTRVFREVAELGTSLGKLDQILGSTVPAEVGLIFDWESSWALSLSAGPNRNRDKNYEPTCMAHYRPFWAQGISVDVINMECEFNNYKLLIAPMLYMVRPGVAERIEQFVNNGGTFVATYLSGMVNESELCFTNGLPGPLRKLMGVWVEETDVLYDKHVQHIVPTSGNSLGLQGEYTVKHYCDIIHLEGAQELAQYTNEFYAQSPAVTVNSFGKGKAYYIGSRNDDRFHADFCTGLAQQLNLKKALETSLPYGVNAHVRTNGKEEFLFLFNFLSTQQHVDIGECSLVDMVSGEKMKTGTFMLDGFGSRIFIKKR